MPSSRTWTTASVAATPVNGRSPACNATRTSSSSSSTMAPARACRPNTATRLPAPRNRDRSVTSPAAPATSGPPRMTPTPGSRPRSHASTSAKAEGSSHSLSAGRNSRSPVTPASPERSITIAGRPRCHEPEATACEKKRAAPGSSPRQAAIRPGGSARNRSFVCSSRCASPRANTAISPGSRSVASSSTACGIAQSVDRVIARMEAEAGSFWMNAISPK